MEFSFGAVQLGPLGVGQVLVLSRVVVFGFVQSVARGIFTPGLPAERCVNLSIHTALLI